LSELNSVSKTAIYRLIAYVVAVTAHQVLVFFELFVPEIEAKVAAAPIATKPWFAARALAYQQGDPLVVDNFAIGYADIDEDKQLIKRVAVSNNNDRFVRMKVAAESGGEGVALSSAQLMAFDSYMKQVMPAGVDLEIISLNGDALQVDLEVFFSGIFLQTTIQGLVEAAINDYCANLSFDGKVSLQKLEAAILAVEGVEEIKFALVKVVNGVQENTLYSLSDSSNKTTQETFSGYVNYDSDNSNIIYTIFNG